MQQVIKVFLAVKSFPWHKYFPAIFFFGGFAWDAFTIGKQVQASDLIMLSGYLLMAAAILWWLAHHSQRATVNIAEARILRLLPENWRAPAPYFLLQFLYGNLLSSLFIVYFKSSSHLSAIVWSLVLASLLVGNEYLEDHYHEHTISWTMFGFCTILLLNFILPSVVGSIHWFWFVLSTLLGAGLTHLFYKKSAQPMVHIAPTWLLATLLMIAYFEDIIPPVPLVKQDAVIGTQLLKANGTYRLQVNDYPWWQPWNALSDDVEIIAGERVYCVTAIFAPEGLHTRLYHRWMKRGKNGWETTSIIGFTLNGGRQGGFRGYTYKQNLAAGEWRVLIETEDGHTLSTDSFTLRIETGKSLRKTRSI
jgi:hypothetical protein